jgi:hypothetical protein
MAETTNPSFNTAPPHPLRAAPRRLTLVKGVHRWRFRWDAGDEPALINHIAHMARDAHVPFDWFDAAIVCRQIAQPGEAEPHSPASHS